MARKAERKRYYQPIWEKLKAEWEKARSNGTSSKGVSIWVEVPSAQVKRFYKAVTKEKDLENNWPPKQFLKMRTTIESDNGSVAIMKFSLRTYRTGALMTKALSAPLDKLSQQESQDG